MGAFCQQALSQGEPRNLYKDDSGRYKHRPDTLNYIDQVVAPEIERAKERAHEKEVTEKAQKVIERVQEIDYQNLLREQKGEAPVGTMYIKHPYEDGVESLQQVGANLKKAQSSILDPTTFYQCMDYKIIGVCVDPVTKKESPYVQYWMPSQMVENTNHPLLTGFLPKSLVKTAKESLRGFNENIIRTRPMQGDANQILQIKEKLIEKINSLQERFRNRPPEWLDKVHGVVTNEFHHWPTFLDYYIAPAMQMALTDPTAAQVNAFFGKAFCHEFKLAHRINLSLGGRYPMAWNSDMGIGLMFSRIGGGAGLFFFEEDPQKFHEREAHPHACLAFNANPQSRVSGFFNSPYGRQPFDVAIGAWDEKDPELLQVVGERCQGINQGSWLPAYNTSATAFHSTAFALGTVRGIKIPFKKVYIDNLSATNPADRVKNPYYDFTYSDQYGLRDKVQWIVTGNPALDGPPSTESVKECGTIQKFVLDYQKGIEKVGVWEKELFNGGSPTVPPVGGQKSFLNEGLNPAPIALANPKDSIGAEARAQSDFEKLFDQFENKDTFAVRTPNHFFHTPQPQSTRRPFPTLPSPGLTPFPIPTEPLFITPPPTASRTPIITTTPGPTPTRTPTRTPTNTPTPRLTPLPTYPPISTFVPDPGNATPGEPTGHYALIAHWRMIRCCVMPRAVPVSGPLPEIRE